MTMSGNSLRERAIEALEERERAEALAKEAKVEPAKREIVERIRAICGDVDVVAKVHVGEDVYAYMDGIRFWLESDKLHASFVCTVCRSFPKRLYTVRELADLGMIYSDIERLDGKCEQCYQNALFAADETRRKEEEQPRLIPCRPWWHRLRGTR